MSTAAAAPRQTATRSLGDSLGKASVIGVLGPDAMLAAPAPSDAAAGLHRRLKPSRLLGEHAP